MGEKSNTRYATIASTIAFIKQFIPLYSVKLALLGVIVTPILHALTSMERTPNVGYFFLAVLFGLFQWQWILFHAAYSFLLVLVIYNTYKQIKKGGSAHLFALCAGAFILVSLFYFDFFLADRKSIPAKMLQEDIQKAENRKRDAEFKRSVAALFPFAANDVLYRSETKSCLPFESMREMIAQTYSLKKTDIPWLETKCKPKTHITFRTTEWVEPEDKPRIFYDTVIIWSGKFNEESMSKGVAVYFLNESSVAIVSGWDEDHVWPTIDSNMRDYTCQFGRDFAQKYFKPDWQCRR